jgi:protein-disulfide isomerase
MRFCLRVWAISALWFVMFGTDAAHADVPRIADGNGILAGSVVAPIQLEIFCEPQCPHCAELESTYGDRIAADVAGGRLAVTYRWLTFLDGKHHNDVSARVTNALFLAADPSTSPTAYQAFVQDLYRHQSHDGPTTTTSRRWPAEAG